jgi:pSer/pThr/pTyr-binding forkhead associated (FHA) protein
MVEGVEPTVPLILSMSRLPSLPGTKEDTMPVSLVPLDEGKPFVVSLPILLVGRGADCDFRLEDDGIADLHCVLAASGNFLLVRDLGTGRTFVNHQRVHQSFLLPNDQLTIAGCHFLVRFDE